MSIVFSLKNFNIPNCESSTKVPDITILSTNPYLFRRHPTLDTSKIYQNIIIISFTYTSIHDNKFDENVVIILSIESHKGAVIAKI